MARSPVQGILPNCLNAFTVPQVHSDSGHIRGPDRETCKNISGVDNVISGRSAAVLIHTVEKSSNEQWRIARSRDVLILLYSLTYQKAIKIKFKGKVIPVPFSTEHHAMKAYWGMEVQLHAFFYLGTRWR
jgi:hypothetical protein